MSRVSRAFRITGKIIKYLFILLIVAINAFFLWRIFGSEDPSSMKALSPNEALAEAFEKDGDLTGMFRQEQRSITSGETNYGYFAVTKATFIPSANQIQIIVRYNNSTLRNTQRDYGLAEAPAREEDVYDVSLLLVTDLTPENKDDNLTGGDEATSKVRIFPTYCEKAEKNLYNFRLFVFDLGELDLSEHLENGTLISVFTDIYYKNAADYSKPAYGTLCIYDYITETIDVKLSSKDKKAIAEWQANN